PRSGSTRARAREAWGRGSPRRPGAACTAAGRRSARWRRAPGRRSSSVQANSRPLLALAAAGMHLEVRVLLEPRDLDQRRALAERQALLGAPVGALPPAARDERGELLALRAAAQRPPQIRPLERVEAEVPHAVRREPAPVALRA